MEGDASRRLTVMEVRASSRSSVRNSDRRSKCSRCRIYGGVADIASQCGAVIALGGFLSEMDSKRIESGHDAGTWLAPAIKAIRSGESGISRKMRGQLEKPSTEGGSCTGNFNEEPMRFDASNAEAASRTGAASTTLTGYACTYKLQAQGPGACANGPSFSWCRVAPNATRRCGIPPRMPTAIPNSEGAGSCLQPSVAPAKVAISWDF